MGLAEERREPCLQTTCVPRCQMSLPTRISCLAPPVAHPVLGQVLLVASESGVIRWVDFAIGALVKEIRLVFGRVSCRPQLHIIVGSVETAHPAGAGETPALQHPCQAGRVDHS